MEIYLLIINAVSLLLMFLDKFFARRKLRRIPESTLFLCAVLGGSAGGTLGMYLFRHKTRHRLFSIGFPLILTLQLILAVLYFVR